MAKRKSETTKMVPLFKSDKFEEAISLMTESSLCGKKQRIKVIIAYLERAEQRGRDEKILSLGGRGMGKTALHAAWKGGVRTGIVFGIQVAEKHDCDLGDHDNCPEAIANEIRTEMLKSIGTEERMLTWKCDICHKERPDHLIGVFTKDITEQLGLEQYRTSDSPIAQLNIKHCNDNNKCIEGALLHNPLKGKGGSK